MALEVRRLIVVGTNCDPQRAQTALSIIDSQPTRGDYFWGSDASLTGRIKRRLS
jgi:hypothetical protein